MAKISNLGTAVTDSDPGQDDAQQFEGSLDVQLPDSFNASDIAEFQTWVSNSYNPSEANAADFEPPRVLDRYTFVMEACLTYLCGDSNTGKTFIALAETIWMSMQGIKCEYFTAEGARATITARMNGIVAGLCPNQAELDNYAKCFRVNFKAKALGTEKVQKGHAVTNIVQFANYVHWRKPQVIVLDPQSVYSGSEINDNGEMADFLTNLREQIIKPSGCAVILIHHSTKDGKSYSGAMQQKALSDIFVMVEEKPREGKESFRSRIEFIKHRDMDRPDPFCLSAAFTPTLEVINAKQPYSVVFNYDKNAASKHAKGTMAIKSGSCEKVATALKGFDDWRALTTIAKAAFGSAGQGEQTKTQEALNQLVNEYQKADCRSLDGKLEYRWKN